MIQFDSRKVKKGDVFVAIKGQNFDGHDFIEEARSRGAVEIYEGKEKLGELAKKYYGDPSSKIKVIGVTGTKGKTTTCHLIHHILTSLGHKCGIISTITTSGLHTTTPDIITLNRQLADMVKKGYEHAVVEVSSHGIDQGRVQGIKFEVGVLTNIAPEHLDYHKTFANYKKTKLDFIKSCTIQVIGNKKTSINILPGEFNNLNAELAVRVCEELGVRKEDAMNTLKTFKLPDGRLEEIKTNKNFRVFVDFAHTPESLEAVLKYLRTLTKAMPAGRQGRLISVFGCAGERDIKKRPKMGKISTDLADLSIFTAEDPRSENIFDILKQMESKSNSKKFISIPQRGEAIVYALSKARKGDVVAILGKGHEKSMNLDGIHEIPWSDHKIVRKYLKKGNHGQ